MNKPLKGFITYSHKNAEQKDELRERLAVMEQQNELVTWDDGQLTPGDKALQEDILKKVIDSDILLYLVSAASLASKNCNKELAEALDQNIRVIPILLEHCDWQRHEVSRFEVLPDKGTPIEDWQPKSKGWQDVVDGISKAVNKIRAQANISSEKAQKDQLAEWVFQQGNFLLMLKQFNKAIEAYSHAINLKPDFSEAYNNRGIAYCSMDEHDKAIEDYDTAIKIDPKHAKAYNNRGVAYDKKDQTDKALPNYNKAIKFNPKSAQAYSNRGLIYHNKGEIDKAIKEYNTALKLDSDSPGSAHTYYNRGNAYSQKGEVDKAIKDYNTTLKLTIVWTILSCQDFRSGVKYGLSTLLHL